MNTALEVVEKTCYKCSYPTTGIFKAMTQMSKILLSRDEWKCKATRRGYENREYRKSQNRHLEKIAELKAQLDAVVQTDELKKQSCHVHC